MPTDSHQPHTLTRILLPWNLNLCTQNTVTKQYNLVLANRRWCLVAGKLTVGLVSHWPRVPDIRHSGSPSKGSRPRRGIRASVYAFLWSTVDSTLPLLLPKITATSQCLKVSNVLVIIQKHTYRHTARQISLWQSLPYTLWRWITI